MQQQGLGSVTLYGRPPPRSHAMGCPKHVQACRCCPSIDIGRPGEDPAGPTTSRGWRGGNQHVRTRVAAAAHSQIVARVRRKHPRHEAASRCAARAAHRLQARPCALAADRETRLAGAERRVATRRVSFSFRPSTRDDCFVAQPLSTKSRASDRELHAAPKRRRPPAAEDLPPQKEGAHVGDELEKKKTRATKRFFSRVARPILVRPPQQGFYKFPGRIRVGNCVVVLKRSADVRARAF